MCVRYVFQTWVFRKRDSRGAAQLQRQSRQPGLQPGLGSAPPQAVAQHQQHHGAGAPVGLEPGVGLPEAADPVHVRQRNVRLAGVEEEVVVPAQAGRHDGGDQVGDHRRPAQELVRDEALQEHRQDREQNGVGGGGQDEPQHIVADLVVGVALDGLHRHAGQGAEDEGGDQHQGDGQALGDDERPVGRGRRVDDLVGPAVAVAPDELAGVVDGDDERDDGVRPPQQRDHLAGHRIGVHAVEFAGEHQAGRGIENAEHHQHQEGRALEHLGHVEPRAGGELGQGRAGPERRAGLGARRRGRGRGRRGLGDGGECLALAGFRAAHREAEQARGRGEEGEPDPDPEQAIGEQLARNRRDQAVALGGRPVAHGVAEGRKAEGLAPGQRVAQLRLARDHGHDDQIDDQEADHRQVGAHHRAGRRGDGEEQGGGQKQPGQSDDDVGPGVVAEPIGPEGLGIQPRHQRAQPDRQRHRQEGDRRRPEGAGEAAVEIVELAHPRGAHDRPEAGLVVAHDAVGHEGRGHEHAEEQRPDLGDLDDRERGVLVDVRGVADVDLVAGDRAERHQEEQDRHDPEDRLAQLVAELEAGDLGEHRRRPQAALGVRRAADRVAK
jgi:hypothetical protein